MNLLLFAVDPNSTAYKVGDIIGGALVGSICGLVVFNLGRTRGRTALGVAGGLLSAAGGFLFGWFGGLPVAGVFAGVILLLGDPDARQPDDWPRRTKKRRPQREVAEEPDDEDDRPRRRRDV